jgi:hypothetical protein
MPHDLSPRSSAGGRRAEVVQQRPEPVGGAGDVDSSPSITSTRRTRRRHDRRRGFLLNVDAAREGVHRRQIGFNRGFSPDG